MQIQVGSGIGELGNLAAYAFAPAILITPMGVLSVLTGVILRSWFLKETLETLGKLGIAICLPGTILVVLHAPPNEDIHIVDEVLVYVY